MLNGTEQVQRAKVSKRQLQVQLANGMETWVWGTHDASLLPDNCNA
jgi:hypothetical protein